MNCVLIDDDIDHREIFEIAFQLAKVNGSLVLIENGPKALRILSDPGLFFDYLFIDVNMTSMNGENLLMEIKKLEHLKNSALYIYTPAYNVLEQKQWISFGVTKVISKPNKMRELVELLQSTITR